MKILKWIVIVIVVVIALAAIIGFMLPRSVHVERSKVVSADMPTVFNLINNPKEFQKWSPWAKIDTNAKIEYFGPPAGKGAGFTWSSTNSDAGYGKWTITESHQPMHITVDLIWEDMDASKVGFMMSEASGGTMLKWTMDADMGWGPFGRIFGTMMESFLAPDYEKGLNNLDSLVKSMPMGRVAKVELQEFPGSIILGIRDTVNIDNIGNSLGSMYGEVFGYMQVNKIQMAGAPVAVYHNFDRNNGTTDLHAGMPVNKIDKGTGRITCLTLPKGHVIVADYFGPYDKMEVAYVAIDKYAAANGKKKIGAPWESYVTDPGDHSSMEKVLTKIYWPCE